jgi:hypothetical protein
VFKKKPFLFKLFSSSGRRPPHITHLLFTKGPPHKCFKRIRSSSSTFPLRAAILFISPLSALHRALLIGV